MREGVRRVQGDGERRGRVQIGFVSHSGGAVRAWGRVRLGSFRSPLCQGWRTESSAHWVRFAAMAKRRRLLGSFGVASTGKRMQTSKQRDGGTERDIIPTDTMASGRKMTHSPLSHRKPGGKEPGGRWRSAPEPGGWSRPQRLDRDRCATCVEVGAPLPWWSDPLADLRGVVQLPKVTDAMSKPTDLVQDTPGLLALKTPGPGPMHGWGISERMKRRDRLPAAISHVIRFEDA